MPYSYELIWPILTHVRAILPGTASPCQNDMAEYGYASPYQTDMARYGHCQALSDKYGLAHSMLVQVGQSWLNSLIWPMLAHVRSDIAYTASGRPMLCLNSSLYWPMLDI